ncbi:HypC/HybG/HupF family hydrogenase formation chaperone [Corallincola platygyrae]|uniref:HypC/HybG/HupF family hydrogenase formation chaperone n=1 Tax=Corallincola platygyrae TaxID=1193278 RepID=A0ABW4XJH8_9GAMM
MCLALPGKLLHITDAENGLALADCGGVRREVDISCLLLEHPNTPLEGRWVLFHVGFALALIDEVEAKQTLALIAELDGQPANSTHLELPGTDK